MKIYNRGPDLPGDLGTCFLEKVAFELRFEAEVGANQ